MLKLAPREPIGAPIVDRGESSLFGAIAVKIFGRAVVWGRRGWQCCRWGRCTLWWRNPRFRPRAGTDPKEDRQACIGPVAAPLVPSFYVSTLALVYVVPAEFKVPATATMTVMMTTDPKTISPTQPTHEMAHEPIDSP